MKRAIKFGFLTVFTFVTVSFLHCQNDAAPNPKLEKKVLKQSKKGGKLDFFSIIKGQEHEAVQVKPGVFTTKIAMALYHWGKESREMGVSSVDEAYRIFSKFRKRNLNLREEEYIKLGFNRGLE